MRRFVGESVFSLLVLLRISSPSCGKRFVVFYLSFISLLELKSVFNMQLLLSSVYGLFLFLLLNHLGSEYARE